MYDTHALAVMLLGAVVVAVLTIQPLSRRFDDSDSGHGTVVSLPPAGRPSLRRATAFFAVAGSVGTLIAAFRHPSLAQFYQMLLTSLLRWLIRDPAAAAAQASHLPPLVPAAFAGYLVTIAIVLPATAGRRLMILAHIPLFLAASLLAGCGLAVFQTAAGVTLQPPALVGMYLQYLCGSVVVFRLFFTSYRLPNLTPVPRLRRGDWRDNLVMIFCLTGATGIVYAAAAALGPAAGVSPVAGAIVILPVQLAVVDVVTALLILAGRAGRRRPEPGPQRPPLDVIIPAYNEAACIERLLRSIDRAAGRYGGPVHVIVCDDGSTDDTAAIAQAVMRSCRHATGVVIAGRHAGKSTALNLALARCTADFVYRLDADCALDPGAFAYSAADFLADPRTGLVGAMQVPKEPYTTWLHRMRAFELVYSFGFLRSGLSQVDAVPCVPGTFCAFRRSAALAVGGFAEGMLGEDAEFTCAIARLGYRTVIDTRVISYEDVPSSLRQLRVQRFRWGIGARMVYARFTPFNRDTGAPGPRFWFQMTIVAGRRCLGPANMFLALLGIEYLLTSRTAPDGLIRLIALLLIAQVMALIPRFVILAYYRKLSILPWAVLWPLFSLLKRFFLLEALLAFQTRPVKPPRLLRGRAGQARQLRPAAADPAGSS